MMNRVNWDGSPFKNSRIDFPADLRESIFEFLPPFIPTTPVIQEMAEQYLKGQFTGLTMGAMQAAYFLHPKPQRFHQQRREAFRLRVTEAKDLGYVIPGNFQKLVENDSYVDRLHHSSICLEMPEELWRLPSDPSLVVFHAFTELHAGCGWHLLLAPDGSHTIVFCEYPFGLPSNWPGPVPDDSKWDVKHCANSIEEWLYCYFLESIEHDQHYIQRLRPYHPVGWSELHKVSMPE